MSEAQEIAMGKEADPQIVAQYGSYEDSALQNFINVFVFFVLAVRSIQTFIYPLLTLIHPKDFQYSPTVPFLHADNGP